MEFDGLVEDPHFSEVDSGSACEAGRPEIICDWNDNESLVKL